MKQKTTNKIETSVFNNIERDMFSELKYGVDHQIYNIAWFEVYNEVSRKVDLIRLDVDDAIKKKFIK